MLRQTSYRTRNDQKNLLFFLFRLPYFLKSQLLVKLFIVKRIARYMHEANRILSLYRTYQILNYHF